MEELLRAVSGRFGTILIDPPWRFMSRTGKVGPEHKRLHRYRTMTFEGPYLELFARQRVSGWTQWGEQVDSYERERRKADSTF